MSEKKGERDRGRQRKENWGREKRDRQRKRLRRDHHAFLIKQLRAYCKRP